jgi:two-component system sensor histidine kinase DegS
MALNDKSKKRSGSALREDLEQELDQTTHRLEDVNLKLEQSQAEVSKIAKRNASINARLQQVQNQPDSVSQSEERSIYDLALETQQRLFVMRGQVDKFQSDKKHLEKYKDLLSKTLAVLEDGDSASVHESTKEAFRVVEATIQAQEAERQRLSRQMHDGPAQALSNFILQTEIAMRFFDIDPDKARDELLELKEASTSAFQQVRDFVFELRPMMLDDLGLIPTLKRYVESFQERTEIQVDLSITGTERRLESYIEVVIFRSIQELLIFAQHQNQATHVKIKVDIGEAVAKVSVEDDGRGFDEEATSRGSGLTIKVIRDRIEMLGGYMEIEENDLGEGSYIHLQLPVGVSGQEVFTDS